MITRSCISRLGFLAIFLIAGCNNAGPEASKTGQNEKGTLRIAVIPKGTSHEFWKSVHYGAQQAADELGNVEILWKGPVLENDREGQIGVVQDFIVQQVDGLCLAPLDSQALVPYVEEAAEKNIPVVIFDSGLDDESKIVSYVATDNRIGGNLAGRKMGELLNGEGGVILLRYNQGSESTFQREEGFLESLRKEFPNVNLLVTEEYAGTTPDSSLSKAGQVLRKHRDDVRGIFAVCEPNATGILGALEDLDLAGKVQFLAFDPNVPLVNGLAEGKVQGIVLQDPVKMGYLTVKSMVQHLRGEKVEKRISTGEYLATPENYQTEQMQQLLKPKQYGHE